jgi:hypothetical protein
MRKLGIVLVVCAVCQELKAVAADSQRHTFLAGDRIVTVQIRFFDPYRGSRLVFYRDEDHGKAICWSGDGQDRKCPELFVGTLATVTYTVRGRAGKLRGKTAIRESVSVSSQSPDLPPRPPLDRTQVLSNGVLTDVQAFGYDESEIPESEREGVRKHAKERLWRVCRQELYLDRETVPFAIITWRYTLDAIEIVGVQAREEVTGP